jgi:hypothetical protein
MPWSFASARRGSISKARFGGVSVFAFFDLVLGVVGVSGVFGTRRGSGSRPSRLIRSRRSRSSARSNRDAAAFTLPSSRASFPLRLNHSTSGMIDTIPSTASR